MKLKTAWTATIAFLTSAFAGFKAEETTLTEEHLEKINAELATHADVKTELATVKENLATANENLATANTSITEKDAKIVELEGKIVEMGKSNPGAASTVKTGDDNFSANEELLTSVDREKQEMIKRGN